MENFPASNPLNLQNQKLIQTISLDPNSIEFLHNTLNKSGKLKAYQEIHSKSALDYFQGASQLIIHQYPKKDSYQNGVTQGYYDQLLFALVLYNVDLMQVYECPRLHDGIRFNLDNKMRSHIFKDGSTMTVIEQAEPIYFDLTGSVAEFNNHFLDDVEVSSRLKNLFNIAV